MIHDHMKQKIYSEIYRLNSFVCNDGVIYKTKQITQKNKKKDNKNKRMLIIFLKIALKNQHMLQLDAKAIHD